MKTTLAFFAGLLIAWLGLSFHPAQPVPASQMTDGKLLEKWNVANSDRYETGLELNRRHLHANRTTPPGINAEGYLKTNLRNCWYGEYYWREPANCPNWTK